MSASSTTQVRYLSRWSKRVVRKSSSLVECVDQLQQRLLDDFAECRVDPDLSVRQLVDRVAEVHPLDERLYQDRGLIADDVGAHEGARPRISDQLAETGRVLERPAVGGGGVRVHDHRERSTALLGLGLRQPHRTDLRTAEHRVGCGSSVEWPQVIGMQEVVLYNAGL